MNRSLIPFPVRDLDRFLSEEFFGRDMLPAVDVYQDKDNVVAELELPGIDPDKLDITIENDVLTVSASSEDKKEVKREDYYHKEIRSGRFSRSVVLPMPVKGGDAEAHYEKGVLRITVPKDEAAKPKKISVQVK